MPVDFAKIGLDPSIVSHPYHVKRSTKAGGYRGPGGAGNSAGH